MSNELPTSTFFFSLLFLFFYLSFSHLFYLSFSSISLPFPSTFIHTDSCFFLRRNKSLIKSWNFFLSPKLIILITLSLSFSLFSLSLSLSLDSLPLDFHSLSRDDHLCVISSSSSSLSYTRMDDYLFHIRETLLCLLPQTSGREERTSFIHRERERDREGGKEGFIERL